MMDVSQAASDRRTKVSKLFTDMREFEQRLGRFQNTYELLPSKKKAPGRATKGMSATDLDRRPNEAHCPSCGVSFRGEPIPEQSQDAYGATHFSRKIGVYSRGQDRTVAWRCPDCGHEWSRD